MRAIVALLVLSGCALVLDLDAQPGNEGGQGVGGDAPTVDNTGASGTGGMPVTSSDTGAGAPTGGAPPTCIDGALAFDGGQQLVVSKEGSEGMDPLNVEDKVAVGAWVQPSNVAAGGGSEDRFIVSRLSTSQARGYALLLTEAGDAGALYPELRLFVDGQPCGCVSQTPVPVGDWSHVAGYYSKPDARVWIDGNEVCSQRCADEKLGKFEAAARVGADLGGQSGFKGLLDYVYVLSPSMTPPPQLSQGVCFPGLKLLLEFDGAPNQTFEPTCGERLTATLGSDPSVGSDDPVFEGCP